MATITDHLKKIGEDIKGIRNYRGLTQRELAEAAGVRVATVNDVEAGKSNLKIDTLVRLSVALDAYLDVRFSPTK